MGPADLLRGMQMTQRDIIKCRKGRYRDLIHAADHGGFELKEAVRAHLDEIGFVVTGHEEGYLKFAPLGGVDPRMLPDRELTVLTDPPLAGVVACLPPHVQTREDMDKSIPIRELCLDVGLSQEAAELLERSDAARICTPAELAQILQEEEECYGRAMHGGGNRTEHHLSE